KLSVPAQALQRLIHLFGVEQWHVEIFLATQKQRRCHYLVSVQERKRYLQPFLQTLPRRPQLGFIVANVLVRAIACDDVGYTRAADRSLETCVWGNGVVREHPPIAPTANPQFVGVGDALRYYVVDCRKHVLRVLVSPIGIDRLREVLAASRASARVCGDYHVAVSREQLPFKVELIAELRHRAAMYS